MHDFFSWLFDSTTFEPHGICLLWRADLVWAQAIADGLIALSYFSIPIVLLAFVAKRKDLVFPWIFILFGAFILLCGTTHVMDAMTFWVPLYGLQTVSKILTALVSVPTAILLWPLIPRVLSLPSISELEKEVASKQRNEETLRDLNTRLAQEVSDKQQAEEKLRDLNAQLEQKVTERTNALIDLNAKLRTEIAMQQQIKEPPEK